MRSTNEKIIDGAALFGLLAMRLTFVAVYALLINCFVTMPKYDALHFGIDIGVVTLFGYAIYRKNRKLSRAAAARRR